MEIRDVGGAKLTILQQAGADKVTKKTAEILNKLGIMVRPERIVKKPLKESQSGSSPKLHDI